MMNEMDIVRIVINIILLFSVFIFDWYNFVKVDVIWYRVLIYKEILVWEKLVFL